MREEDRSNKRQKTRGQETRIRKRKNRSRRTRQVAAHLQTGHPNAMILRTIEVQIIVNKVRGRLFSSPLGLKDLTVRNKSKTD